MLPLLSCQVETVQGVVTECQSLGEREDQLTRKKTGEKQVSVTIGSSVPPGPRLQALSVHSSPHTCHFPSTHHMSVCVPTCSHLIVYHLSSPAHSPTGPHYIINSAAVISTWNSTCQFAIFLQYMLSINLLPVCACQTVGLQCSTSVLLDFHLGTHAIRLATLPMWAALLQIQHLWSLLYSTWFTVESVRFQYSRGSSFSVRAGWG